MGVPKGYKKVERKCNCHVPCAGPAPHGYEIVVDHNYKPPPVGSVDITLRFNTPRDVLTLVEAIVNYHEEAVGSFADNGDGADAVAVVDATALRDSIWQCLVEQGFEIIGNPAIETGKLLYNGEEVTWARPDPIAPVLKGE